MKFLFKFLLIALIPVIAWAAWTYPQVGHHIYALATATEARIYGLEEQDVPIGEMSLATLQGGQPDGEAVILIHGYSAVKEHWLRFARHLNDEYRLIIPDLAGHGATGFDPDWDYSIRAQAERIIALMDALDIQQAHVVGNSMGGWISAYLAWAHPQRLHSAVLMDPGGVTSPIPSDREKLLAQGENVFVMQTREEFDRFYPMTMAKPPWVPGVVIDAQAEKFLARSDQLATIAADFLPRDMLDSRVGEITVPTLILWGEKDQLLHVSATQIWQQIPNSQLMIWPDLGHMPQLESPQRSAERVAQFLAESGA